MSKSTFKSRPVTRITRLTWLLLPLPLMNAVATPAMLPAGYQVETIATPKDSQGKELQFDVGGIDFANDGTAYIAARTEGVWTLKDGVWKQFAAGLHEALGIHVLPENQGVYVSQKPEVTLLRDLDGDGQADLFENFGDQWKYAGNYCEYAHGLVADSRVNLYITLNLADGGSAGADLPGVVVNREAGGQFMGTTTGYDGWMMKITPAGEAIPWAFGLRSPAGIGISKNNEIFYTDNQGEWMPSSPLYFVEPGNFFGHPASMIDLPAFRDGKRHLKDLTPKELEPIHQKPVVWMPQSELVNSPSNPEFNYSKGKFGPFEDQIFIGCQTRSNIVRVNLQKVQGQYQGAVFNFIDHLDSGAIRLRFDSLGRLWVGQTGRGWVSRGGKMYGLQRIVWDGKNLPFEMQTMELTHSGFKVTFTKALDLETARNPDTYGFTHWHYSYSSNYGSPKVGTAAADFKIEKVSDDGKTIWFTLPLVTGEVYQLECKGLKAADGSQMSNTKAYYTLNNLLATATAGESLLISQGIPITNKNTTVVANRRVLLFTSSQGPYADALGLETGVFKQLADKNNFQLTVSSDPEIFYPERLSKFDAVVLSHNTGSLFVPKNLAGLPEKTVAYLSERDASLKASLLDFVNQGGGLAVFNDAALAFPEWEKFSEMLGARPTEKLSDGPMPLKLLAQQAPGAPRSQIRDFELVEQVWLAPSLDRTKVRPILTLAKEGNPPVAWLRDYGKGKVFYCALGHQRTSFLNPAVLQLWSYGIESLLIE